MKSHVWGYGHLAVWASIALTSVGIEFATADASEPTLSTGARAAPCGCLSLYLLAVGAVQWVTPGSECGYLSSESPPVSLLIGFLSP